MKQTLPLIIVFAFGFFVIIAFFIPLRGFQDASQTFETWYTGVIAFFVFIGIFNIVKVNVNKIQRKLIDWQYSIILLVFLVIMMAAGFIGGPEGGVFDYLFQHMQIPLGATMFSLLAFFVAHR